MAQLSALHRSSLLQSEDADLVRAVLDAVVAGVGSGTDALMAAEDEDTEVMVIVDAQPAQARGASMTKKTLRVTQAQVAAARLRLELDSEAGRTPSRAMQRIAAAVLPSDGPELPPIGGSGVPEPSDGSPPVGTMGLRLGEPGAPGCRRPADRAGPGHRAQPPQAAAPAGRAGRQPLAPYLSGLLGAERVEQIQHGQDVVLDPDLYRRLSPKGTQGELSSGDDDGLSISP